MISCYVVPDCPELIRPRGTMRLLLIEDEKKVADFVTRGLRAERFAVDHAADGPAALQMLAACAYDLIILDLMLPGLSGSEILKRIRRDRNEVPVLILTARDAMAEKVAHRSEEHTSE